MILSDSLFNKVKRLDKSVLGFMEFLSKLTQTHAQKTAHLIIVQHGYSHSFLRYLLFSITASGKVLPMMAG